MSKATAGMLKALVCSYPVAMVITSKPLDDPMIILVTPGAIILRG